MHKRNLVFSLSVVLLLGVTLLAGCATPAPQTVEIIVTREVEKIVTQEVEKVVEKVVTQQVSVEKVVTATPLPAKEPVKLSFYLFGPTPERRAAIDAALTVWKAQHPEIEVDIAYEGWMDGRSKALKEIAAGNPRNGVLNFGGWTGEFAKMGVLEPVDKYVASWPDKSKIPDGFWETVTFDGNIYGMPHYSTATVMYWNKDCFKDAGLDPEKPPKTYEELLDYAQKLTKPGRWGLTVQPGTGMIQQFEWIVFSFDKDASIYKIGTDGKHMPGFLGPDGKPLPNIVKGAQFFTDLYSKYKVLPPDVLSAEWYEARTAFASGRACMILDFSLNNRFFSQQPGLNYGVALLPEGPARPYAWISPYDTVFFKGAQHMDEAVEFAKFLGTGQGAKLNSTSPGSCPSTKKLLTEIAEAGDPTYQVFADSFKTAVPQCFAPECGGTEETWTPIIQSMLLGETTPEDAMAQMAAVIQANIDKMYTE